MNIFITGGSRGIGKALVLEAIRQEHNVAFTFRQEEDLARVLAAEAGTQASARCLPYALDVTDSSQVDEVGDRVLEDFGHIDAVICNAGTTDDSLVAHMTDEQWDRVIRTNLTGAFYVCRTFLPGFLVQRSGRIVFMSSIAHRGISGQANYAASKAGLHGLCRTIAKEYGPKGITANVVAPGFFETDLSRAGTSPANLDFWLNHCPLKRSGKLSEVVALILFLAAGEAGFINGQVIPIDGGLDWAP